MPARTSRSTSANGDGRLRIGNDWNAIHIIALSQSNPLKAVAEFVENSIDARAKRITIIRGRERGQSYLKIVDDGEGVPHDDRGRPDFKHVATHICDSLKRQLKARGGAQGIQGEFGIGLLSFWTVGDGLSMISAGADGQTYEMRMAKDDPTYRVVKLRRLVPPEGTELTIAPLLAGIRQLSGEKLQWYLASELRDRIRRSGVKITILDRQARAEYRVEPREYGGQLLHHLPKPTTLFGDLYVELYLADACETHRVGLYRGGTRVLADLAEFDELNCSPWTSGVIQGVVDAPFLNLTPGSRLGVVHDDRLAAFLKAAGELEQPLLRIIAEQEQAAEERATRDTLQSIQRAFREALLALPREEYDWFEGAGRGDSRHRRPVVAGRVAPLEAARAEVAAGAGPAEAANDAAEQRAFFEHVGPLASVRISPASCVVSVGASKRLRAVARDRSGRQVDGGLSFSWRVVEGTADLANGDREIVVLTAPAEPQLLRVAVVVRQGERDAEAEAIVTITDSLLPSPPKSDAQRGLPAYTYEKRPGDLSRSRYDALQNVVVVNNGHRDFVFAARSKSVKLRYLCRLFAKEMVLHNFPGYGPDQLLERMIELSLYTETHLR